MSAPHLETERLILRGWQETDFEPLCALLAIPEVVRYLGREPMSVEECREVLARRQQQFADWGYGIWALERRADGAFLGWTGIAKAFWLPGHEDEVEAVWILHPGHWHQGYATEAAGATLAFGFEHVGLTTILGIRHPENSASARVMRRLGFVDDGTATAPSDGSPLLLAHLTRQAWLDQSPVRARIR